VALLQGISRNLEKIFRLQGAHQPIESELRTPIQTVQVVDDVSALSTPPDTAHGWYFLSAPAQGATAFSSLELTAAPSAGFWVRFDPPPVGNPVNIYDARPPTYVVGAATFSNRLNFGALPYTMPIGGVGFFLVADINAGVALDSVDVPDWMYVRAGGRIIIAERVLNSAFQLAFQVREIPS